MWNWSIQLIAALAAEGNDQALERIFSTLPYTDAGFTLDLCGLLSGVVLPARPEDVIKTACRLDAALGQAAPLPTELLVMCARDFQPFFGESATIQRVAAKLGEAIARVRAVSLQDASAASLQAKVLANLVQRQKTLRGQRSQEHR